MSLKHKVFGVSSADTFPINAPFSTTLSQNRQQQGDAANETDAWKKCQLRNPASFCAAWRC